MHAVSEINPGGTAFLGVIDELIDLLRNPSVSRIEVVIASYELNDDGEHKMTGGKDSVAMRPIAISGMSREVQESLRTEINAAPILHLMILWIDRAHPPMGVITFNAVGSKGADGIPNYTHIEKSIIADYLRRQVQSK